MAKKKELELCKLYMSGDRLLMALDDLVGYHYLSGCEPGTLENGEISANYFKFVLDGKIYVAIEDPDDGYRSCMDSILVEPEGEIHNVFEPVLVYCECEPGEDVLNITHAVTNELIISVGTENHDGYYPYFVQRFYPQYIDSIRERRCKECVCKTCMFHVKGECMAGSASSCDGHQLGEPVKTVCVGYINN
jgi:hypothetical protein